MSSSLYEYVNWTGKSGPFKVNVRKEAFNQHKRLSKAVISKFACIKLVEILDADVCFFSLGLTQSRIVLYIKV